MVGVALIVVVAVYFLLVQSPFAGLPNSVGEEKSEWRLLVNGLVQRPLNLSLKEIVVMPRKTVNAEIHCLPAPGSTGLLVDSGNWTGVRLGLILEEAGVLPEAVKVAFYAEDGFATDLTIGGAMGEDVILAYEKDGEPLRQKLRLAVPGRWGYKWIYLLNHVEVVDYDFLGTYESSGFPDSAEIPSTTPSPSWMP
jgi:DMSO/TMAO reductase YedYZ molybdopterin-dependent catalytic subunit